jgi:hypothetical protein
MTKANGIAIIQELLASSQEEKTDAEQTELEVFETELGVPPTTLKPGSNRGTLLLDATCVADDIPYPVDLRLPNVDDAFSAGVAREVTETIIDKLFKQLKGKIDRKPRCSRDKARNLFLAFIKKKKPKKDEIQGANRFQLNKIKRNLTTLDHLIHCGAVLLELGTQLYRKLLITSELYRQQQEIYDEAKFRVDHRIVNLSKLHIRPITRSKAGKKTEFDARISISPADDDVAAALCLLHGCGL